MTKCVSCDKPLGNPKAIKCLDCATREFHDNMERDFPGWKNRQIDVEEILNDL